MNLSIYYLLFLYEYIYYWFISPVKLDQLYLIYTLFIFVKPFSFVSRRSIYPNPSFMGFRNDTKYSSDYFDIVNC